MSTALARMSFADSVRSVLRALASLKLTLVILIALALGVAVAYHSETRTTWALVVPLTLAALNLMAAVVTNGVFRRQSALLAFHLALIAILLLVAAGRLSYLKGQIELTDGEEFNGVPSAAEAGPWHWWRLDRVRFVNQGFDIEYAPGVRRGKTRNALRYIDDDGRAQSAVIGDNDPLVLHGYRIYTSSNKGFAPTFLWQPAKGGAAQFGSVHLPAYPVHEYEQAREWQPPGSAHKVWVMLQFDEVILDPEKPSEFRLPTRHTLVVRVDGQRREIVPGEQVRLPDGVLTYEGLRAWMGYSVFSDWTIHWLLASGFMAVASLAWHFWHKFAARPWNA